MSSNCRPRRVAEDEWVKKMKILLCHQFFVLFGQIGGGAARYENSSMLFTRGFVSAKLAIVSCPRLANRERAKRARVNAVVARSAVIGIYLENNAPGGNSEGTLIWRWSDSGSNGANLISKYV